MKKVLFTMLALVLAIGLSIPMAVPVFAATTSVVSDTSVQIVGVYNEAGGVSTYVDLSGSPLNAVRAQEPKPYPTGYVTEPPEVTNSVWDTGTGNYFAATAADWIWETERAEWAANYDVSNPLYDADASRYGRVVVFEQTFNIPGSPLSGMLHITADNCVEVWINGVYLNRSATAKVAGWELTNLHEASVATNGWQTVNHWAVPAASLVMGSNTIKILAANEYYWNDGGDTNTPVPPYLASPYRQQNPGALIFKLDVEYEEFVADPEITIVKEADVDEALEGETITYTYTVTNTGNVPLSNVAVTDPDVDTGPTYVSGDTNDDDLLDLTETWIYTAEYTVPWFTAGPVENTGTATAEYEGEPVTNTDNESVDILHDPDIEVDKTGPDDTIGYFEQLDADYDYAVTNTGDCSLTVVLTDDQIATLNGPTGDDGNGYLDPSETWYYTSNQLIECTGFTELVFTNIATAVGTDATGGQDTDTDSWTVTIFQWQPRTIGYWGNWANHYTDTEMSAIADKVDSNSAYFGTPGPDLTASTIKSLLLAVDQSGKMTQAKARLLVQKQLLAAWLNVKSYKDWAEIEDIPDFTGSDNAAMRPGATVYLSKVAGAQTLFGAATKTVQEVLDAVDAGMSTWNQNQLLIAKTVLDMMNNAENNGYFMFIP
jgi:uncharacterized repeat protein (TIGR01451 family)